MVYEVRRSVASRRDIETIFNYLIDAHEALGESVESAIDLAAWRIAAIENAIDALGVTPHQGTLRLELVPGLRWVLKERAVLYFTVDAAARLVDLLAIVFGDEDHKRRILGSIRGA